LGVAMKQNCKKLTVQEMVQLPLPLSNQSLERKETNKKNQIRAFSKKKKLKEVQNKVWQTVD